MPKLLTIFLVTVIAASAQTNLRKDKKAGALSLLPPGSQMTDLRLPRYDNQRKLSTLTQVGKLSIIDENTLFGENIDVRMYEGGVSSTRLSLKKARVERTASLLTSTEPLTITDAGGTLTAKGIVIQMETKQAFFIGPCKTLLYLEKLKQRTQNATSNLAPMPSPFTSIATIVSLMSSPAFAIIPGDLTEAQREEISQALISDHSQFRTESEKSQASLEAFKKDSATVDQRLTKLRAAISNQDLKTIADKEEPALLVKAKPDIEASCEEGIYLDPEQNAFVYVKDVSFTDHSRGLHITAGKEVKAFLTKKKIDPKAKKKDSKKPAIFDQFEDIKSVVASGGVFARITFKNGTTATAKGDTLFVDNIAQRATLQGGYPTLTKGKTSQRIKNKDGRIIVDLASGQISVVGPVEQIIHKADIEQP